MGEEKNQGGKEREREREKGSEEGGRAKWKRAGRKLSRFVFQGQEKKIKIVIIIFPII